MYADDVVLLADSPVILQKMIRSLEQYCRLWNLTVNLNKSKVMVFRRGVGRYAQSEKWTFEGEEIEVVREYKYLGVILRSNLSMHSHLAEKLITAKTTLNTTWRACMNSSGLPPSAKYKVFQSTACSVMFYAAQVWGITHYEEVEKLLRFFIKRCFHLPQNSPNYMLLLETGLPTLHMSTVKLHFDYILRILTQMPDTRLPKRVVNYAIHSNSLFFKEWISLAESYNLELNLSTRYTDNWRESLYKFREDLDAKVRESLIEEAKSSVYRNYYRELEFNLKELNYFTPEHSAKFIEIIFRTRGELLRLNYVPHRDDLPILCTLCNMNTREDLLHFLSICPILKDIRMRCLGRHELNWLETRDVLNGKAGWPCLYSFVTTATSYRQRIVDENF